MGEAGCARRRPDRGGLDEHGGCRGRARRRGGQARAKAPAAAYISWVALAMMTTSSVASLRAAPTMAVYGLACVFLYLVPAIVFLLPTSLVSAELASGWKGGVYNWVSEGISKPMGFLAVWCQFAMTIFYYPSLLGFVASTLAYVFNPELASSGVWTAVRDRRRLLVRRLGLLARHQGRRRPGQRRPDHRHPDPRASCWSSSAWSSSARATRRPRR